MQKLLVISISPTIAAGFPEPSLRPIFNLKDLSRATEQRAMTLLRNRFKVRPGFADAHDDGGETLRVVLGVPGVEGDALQVQPAAETDGRDDVLELRDDARVHGGRWGEREGRGWGRTRRSTGRTGNGRVDVRLGRHRRRRVVSR